MMSPIRKPLRPAASIKRAACSPGGLVNVEPQLHSPIGCVSLRRAIMSRMPSSVSPGRGSNASTAPRKNSPGTGATIRRYEYEYSRASRRRSRPRASHTSTARTRGQVSPPNAPAFIVSAPPSVPGMPAKNSAGPSCRPMARRAMRAHGTPASAYRVVASISSSSSRPVVSMTTPRMPPSRTSRLEPRPSQNSGVPVGSASRNASRSVRSVGVKNTSAGPPTCHDVWRDIGSAYLTRAANSWR